jgi:hypothetical protein
MGRNPPCSVVFCSGSSGYGLPAVVNVIIMSAGRWASQWEFVNDPFKWSRERPLRRFSLFTVTRIKLICLRDHAERFLILILLASADTV